MSLPASTFASVPLLFLEAADSELREYLAEIPPLVSSAPALLSLVDADLDAHGCRKKAVRVVDARWREVHSVPLPGAAPVPTEVDPKSLKLGLGRPRTPAFVVLVAVLLRGFLGAGFKARDPDMMLAESVTLRVFFKNQGYTMPGRSTLTELCNAVSNRTRLSILDAQTALVLRLGFDDFSVMLQDSTHVEGSTVWPVDSRMLVGLVSRLAHIGAVLPRLNVSAVVSPGVDRRLAEMRVLDREISLAPARPGRGRERRKRYEQLIKRARRVLALLNPLIAAREAELQSLDVLPSRKAMAVRAVAQMRTDLTALAQVIANSNARVIHEQKVPMADKKLSISDTDVGFIAKGQRVPVVGYKPQIARSGRGFIVGLLLPQGNAADSGQLVPMLDSVIARTGVVPTVVSVDDGYSSKDNVAAMKARGVNVRSINGAKGRALTDPGDWDSEPYAGARGQRSAVESIMYTLKYGYNFGEVARRGLEAVYGELLEKALAFNLCHLARARRAATEAAARAAAPPLAAAA